MNNPNYHINLSHVETSPPHIHEGLECLFIVSGELNIELDGSQHHLVADDIIVVNPNQLHSVQGNPSTLLLLLYVEREFFLNECPEMLRSSFDCKSCETAAGDSGYSELKKTLIQLKLVEAEKADGFELNMRSILLRFFYILQTFFSVVPHKETLCESSNNAPELSAVLQYMHKYYYRPISLQDMADLTFMSPQYFSKYFKKKIGKNFHGYLQTIRLESAIKDLLSSNDSISHIALANGFANTKAFSASFTKRYGDTPSSYRKKHGGLEKHHGYSTYKDMTDNINGDITVLLHSMRKYDLLKEEDTSANELLSIDVRSSNQRFLRSQSNFLNIGLIDNALRVDFLNDLKIKFAAGIQYVYFYLWEEATRSKITREMFHSVWDYHIKQAIDIFYSIGLSPVFKLQCDNYEQLEATTSLSDAEIIDQLLKSLVLDYPKEYLETWMFEIILGDMPPVNSILVYREMRAIIKRHLPNAAVGIFSVVNTNKDKEELFSRRLSLAAGQDCLPDFVTFSVFPNDLRDEFLPDITYYPFDGYHRKVALAIKSICEEAGCESTPLYMINWNTISGTNRSELGVYFRSALILQVLMDLNDLIDGSGYWYNTNNSNYCSNEFVDTPLALIYINNARRPVYFVLEAFSRLGDKLLWSSDHAVATFRENAGEWVILVWNPSYLNPFFCTIPAMQEREEKTVSLELCGLRAGSYQFKRFDMSYKNSGVLSQYASAGLPVTFDDDTYDYLQAIAGKQTTLFEEQLNGKPYALTADISMNGVLMLVVRRVG